MDNLITEADSLLRNGDFEYAVCGGFAIELFLNRKIRKHGDIDIAAFEVDRDRIILYMQSLGWDVYEMCGNGIAHHVTDVHDQIRVRRNIFCFKADCELISLTPQSRAGFYHLDFDPKGQSRFDFMEFLFNDKSNNQFLYVRNKEITLPLSVAIRNRSGIPYLAPEMVLLYKSTDISREGYQSDFDAAIVDMDHSQKAWLKNALGIINPSEHPWLAGCE